MTTSLIALAPLRALDRRDAHASPGLPEIDRAADGTDLAAFRAARDDFSGTTVHLGAPGAALAPPLDALTRRFHAREAALSAEMRRAIRTSDAERMVTLAARVQDMTVEGELTAKVIGKSIAAVDQLTRLS